MDLLANILSAVLVCGIVGVGIAIAQRIGRAAATRIMMRRRHGSVHRAHVLTDTMVHYRPNIRMMKETLKPAG